MDVTYVLLREARALTLLEAMLNRRIEKKKMKNDFVFILRYIPHTNKEHKNKLITNVWCPLKNFCMNSNTLAMASCVIFYQPIMVLCIACIS